MKVAAGVTAMKGLVVPAVIGGGVTTGAILAESGGVINESTGIAIGFVGGMIVAAATGAWFIRGVADDMKHKITDLEKDNRRLKHKLGLED